MTDFLAISREHPLIAFSPYTHGQATYLVGLGQRLSLAMDSFQGTVNDLNETYHQFWLWVLGAYETVRTLDQHSANFSPEFAVEVKELKQFLVHIRMPFAKQEFRGRQEAIKGDLSVVGTDRDLIFSIDDKKVSARDAIERYANLVSSISLEQLCPMHV